ncbi:MAG: hypothetical protein AAB581_04350 [Patescibacteria group bacterium]
MKVNLAMFGMCVLLLGISACAAHAAVTLESGIPGADDPNTPNVIEGQAGATVDITLDRYINLLYLFALGFVGIAGFVALVIWGVVWTFSGIVDKKAMAMEGIKNTLIGIGIALTAYLILFTINPSLVNITWQETKNVQPINTQTKFGDLPDYLWGCEIYGKPAGYIQGVHIRFCSGSPKPSCPPKTVGGEPSPAACWSKMRTAVGASTTYKWGCYEPKPAGAQRPTMHGANTCPESAKLPSESCPGSEVVCWSIIQ